MFNIVENEDTKWILDRLNQTRRYYNMQEVSKFNDSVNLIYLNALGKYKKEDIVFAFSKHFSDPEGGKYMPKVANLVSHLVHDKKTKDEYSGLKAYEWLIKASKNFGISDNIKFSHDNSITRTIKMMGGWIACKNRCRNPDDSLFKHQFINTYLTYSKHESFKRDEVIINDPKVSKVIDCSDKLNYKTQPKLPNLLNDDNYMQDLGNNYGIEFKKSVEKDLENMKNMDNVSKMQYISNKLKKV